MDIIKSGNSAYEEYERLLLKRDAFLKDGESANLAYLQMFGSIQAKIYETKLECVKKKKTIEYIQSFINRGENVDAADMRGFIDREMTSYYAELRRMLKEKKKADEATVSNPYEVKRSKELYRRLAKLLHPDLNPHTDRNNALSELWHRTRIAYACNDVKELAEIEVLVRKVLRDLNIDGARADIPDLKEKTEELKNEIYEITTSEPYTYIALLEDETAVNEKMSGLKAQLDEAKAYLAELEKILKQIILTGGVNFDVR